MMTNEKGQYTKIAEKVGKILVSSDFVTNYGECVELHESVINNVVCDITNVLLKQEEITKVKETYIPIKKENNSIYNVGGYFYHLLFKNVLDENLEENYLIRFYKLCTFLNYDNVLVQGNTKKQSKILESNLENVLNLSERELRNTKKYLVENNLISINANGVITINEKYAIREKEKVIIL